MNNTYTLPPATPHPTPSQQPAGVTCKFWAHFDQESGKSLKCQDARGCRPLGLFRASCSPPRWTGEDLGARRQSGGGEPASGCCGSGAGRGGAASSPGPAAARHVLFPAPSPRAGEAGGGGRGGCCCCEAGGGDPGVAGGERSAGLFSLSPLFLAVPPFLSLRSFPSLGSGGNAGRKGSPPAPATYPGRG